MNMESKKYPNIFIMIVAMNFNSAILVRTAPVLTLMIKAVFKNSGIINIGEKKCVITQDDYLINDPCFNMTIKIYSISKKFK